MASIDARLISQLLSVSTPNVSDALDRLGIEGAPQGILPIYTCPKIAGPAATLKLVPNGKAQESTVLGTLRAIVKGGAGSVHSPLKPTRFDEMRLGLGRGAARERPWPPLARRVGT